MDELPKDRCPECGWRFEDVKDENTCLQCGEKIKRSELITEDDDYTWVL